MRLAASMYIYMRRLHQKTHLIILSSAQDVSDIISGAKADADNIFEHNVLRFGASDHTRLAKETSAP